MRFSKKEKEVYIYDGKTPSELIDWYAANVNSEKIPFNDSDASYWLNNCDINPDDLFWVGVATAPKITTYYITNARGEKKKFSRDAIVTWLGLDCMLNWGRYLELIAQSALNGTSSTVIKTEKQTYKVEFITKFPRTK